MSVLMDEFTDEAICLEQLPVEILQKILAHVDLHDLGSMSRVSKTLKNVVDSVWKMFVTQRWPHANKIYHQPFDWKSFCKELVETATILQTQLSSMSEKFYHKEELSDDDFEAFIYIINDVSLLHHAICLLVMEHSSIRNSNLTTKYYAQKLTMYLSKKLLTAYFIENVLFVGENFQMVWNQKYGIDDGALLLDKWFLPSIILNDSYFSTELNRIASLAQSHLKVNFPHNPSFSFLGNKSATPDTTLLSFAVQKQILLSINHVMFEELKFEGDRRDLEANLLTTKVLERRSGSDITLCIVYMSVAKRLGVTLQPVYSPIRVLLSLTPNDKKEPLEFSYIDVFCRGKFYSSLPSTFIIGQSGEVVSELPVKELLLQLVRLLLRAFQQDRDAFLMQRAIQLFLVLEPNNTEMKTDLAQLYLHHNINFREVVEMFQSTEASSDAPQLFTYLRVQADLRMQAASVTPEAVIQRRTVLKHDVLFSVGMVMRHKRYGYSCVINGWDEECKAGMDWIIQMGVHHLPSKQFQPFYNVLVDDGSNRYAAQENLEINPEPALVTHKQVGRYFQSFNGSRYEPNAELRLRYPDG